MSTFQHYSAKISNTEHFYLWTDSDSDLSTIISKLQQGLYSNTHLIYWAPEEWTFGGLVNKEDIRTLRNLLDSNNSFMTFVVGTFRNVYGADDKDKMAIRMGDVEPTVFELEYYIDRVDVVYWYSFFMYHTAHNYLETSRNNELNQFQAQVAHSIAHDQPTHLWTTMIGECWYHRKQALELMAQQGVMPYGKVILNHNKHPDQFPQFEHWDMSNMVRSVSDSNPVDQYGVWPQEYTLGLIDIVMESTIRSRFATEKTWRPVFYGKPMVILGARSINNAFHESMGGWPVDQFMDMSWDQYRHYEDRVKGLCEQLHIINDKWGNRLEDYRNELSNMTGVAKNHVQLCIKQKNFIPEFIKQHTENHSSMEFQNKVYSGYSGKIDFITDFSWYRKQQIANQQSAISDEEVNSEHVSWLL